MKAIRVHQFGEPDVMKLETVPDPTPSPGEVLVRIKAVGVNPVDTYIRAGSYGKLPMPYTPGLDAAGTVEAVGAGGRAKVGDRVYLSGTLTGAYAEKAICKVEQVHRLPDKVTFAQGAGVNVPYATAHRSLFQKAQAKGGEVVLVHGASGGVGVAAVQIARAAGLIVIGTAGSDKGLALVKEQGAHHVLDHRKPDYLKEVIGLSDGRGVDVVLEMLANVNLGKDLTIMAPGGRVVVIGSRGSVEVSPRELMVRDVTVLGMVLFNATPPETASIHAALVAGLENGTLRPITGRELPLAEAPQAHKAVMESGAYGKIVLIP
nr:NADPH:quinone reductase [Nitrospirota bacterium]